MSGLDHDIEWPHPAMAALDRALDDGWRVDRDYVIADINGSAVFRSPR